MKLFRLYYMVFITLFCFSHLEAIVFVQGVTQLFGLSVQNKSDYPLVVVDDVYFAENFPTPRTVEKTIINPGNYYRSRWVTAAVGRDYKSQQTKNVPWIYNGQPPIGRTLTIWGEARGSTLTNRIIIGNTTNSTYQQTPSGTYTIINKIGAREQICIAQPYNVKVCQ